MIRRLFTLQIILLAGLSIIWLLPSTPEMQAAAINLDGFVSRLAVSGFRATGEVTREGSKEERERLASDTQFARRQYRRVLDAVDQPHDSDAQLVDELNTSLVLSGQHLSGSIHALERCLGAQGFNILEESTLKVTLLGGKVLPVRRLLCERSDDENRVYRSIAYYWFVGHDAVTSNHIRRGFMDIWDRIVHGYNQHWGYITVTAYLTGGWIFEEPKNPDPKAPQKPVVARDPDTGRPVARRDLTPEQADKLVQEFIGEFGQEVVRVDQIKDWPDE